MVLILVNYNDPAGDHVQAMLSALSHLKKQTRLFRGSRFGIRQFRACSVLNAGLTAPIILQ